MRGGEASHWTLRAAPSVLLPDAPFLSSRAPEVAWEAGFATVGDARGTFARFATPEIAASALVPGRLVIASDTRVYVYALPEGTLLAVQRALHPAEEADPAWISALHVRDGRVRALLGGGDRGRVVEMPLEPAP